MTDALNNAPKALNLETEIQLGLGRLGERDAAHVAVSSEVSTLRTRARRRTVRKTTSPTSTASAIPVSTSAKARAQVWATENFFRAEMAKRGAFCT